MAPICATASLYHRYAKANSFMLLDLTMTMSRNGVNRLTNKAKTTCLQ